MTKDERLRSAAGGAAAEVTAVALDKPAHWTYNDNEGYLVFSSERAYAEYLDKQKGKLPGEVQAYFIRGDTAAGAAAQVNGGQKLCER